MVNWNTLTAEQRDEAIRITGATRKSVIRKFLFVIAELSGNPVARYVALGIPKGDYIVNTASEIIRYCKGGEFNKLKWI